ncbi:MAG: thiamine-phosphate pyrophosphorylase [Gemmatimonadetes bacterium]|nr:thiamine-phosphate pyrophosphorylase [Gemmatimonadota bacterium]
MLDPTVNVRPATSAAIPVVHAVTSDEIVARADFIDVACAVMAALGTRGALHLRAGRVPAARLQVLAEGLEAAQAITGAWLVINDRIDLALAVRARGAQLTSRSLAVSDARRAAPALALGASVHTLEEGRAAGVEGANWLVAGHVFATASHPGEPERGLPFVRGLVQAVRVPVLAIGGVRPEHGSVLRDAGVYGVAVIRGIWDAANAERAASDYLSSYDNAAGA